MSCLGPNYDISKREIESVIVQRDKLRKQVESLNRDLRLAQEKLVSVAGSRDLQREKSSGAEVSELKAELSRLRKDGQSLAKERERLVEENGELRSKHERVESRVHSLEMECQRYNTHTLSEAMYSLCVHALCRLRDSSPVRGLGKTGAMRGSSEDLLAIRASRGYRGSLPYKKFSPVSFPSTHTHIHSTGM